MYIAIIYKYIYIYVFQAMAFHFDREDVALPGFGKIFTASSVEEREHAEKLMKFQNQRGGRIVLAVSNLTFK